MFLFNNCADQWQRVSNASCVLVYILKGHFHIKNAFLFLVLLRSVRKIWSSNRRLSLRYLFSIKIQFMSEYLLNFWEFYSWKLISSFRGNNSNKRNSELLSPHSIITGVNVSVNNKDVVWIPMRQPKLICWKNVQFSSI